MKRDRIAKLLAASGGKGDNEILRRAVAGLEPSRGTGWVSYTDTVYTSENPLSCPGGERTNLTITYAAPDIGGAYAGDMGAGVVEGSKFMALAVGDAYLIRLGITMRTVADMQATLRGLLAGLLTGNAVAGANEKQNDVTLGVDFGTFAPSDTRTCPRESGRARDFTALFLVQVRGTENPALTTGGTFFVEPDENTEVYDIDVSIQRVFSPE